jgi:phage baseplate assembly protein W
MVQIIARQPDYSDLDLDFLPNPATGDVVRKTGEDAVKRSVRNLLLTNYYDRPFRSYIGSEVRRLLFENINPLTATFLTDAITQTLRNYEPRISLIEVLVSVSADNNGYNVRLSYNILNNSQPVTINLFLNRIR